MNVPENGNSQPDQSSNDISSSFLFQFASRPPQKKSSQSLDPLQFSSKIQQLKHLLITKISIITPSRIRACHFRNQLRNYQYHQNPRKGLTRFGFKQQQLMKEQQNTIITLLSLMHGFKLQINRYFYIVLPTQVIYFRHYKTKANVINTEVLIGNKGVKLKQILQQQSIDVKQEFNKQEIEQLIIKDQNVIVFWGWLINRILSAKQSFDVIANYMFLNAFQSTCIEKFNGYETKEEYKCIAVPMSNLLGESIEKVHRMEVQGFWTSNNINLLVDALNSQFKELKFDMEFVFHGCAEVFRDMGN